MNFPLFHFLVAYATISIEVPNTSIELKKTDVEVKCLVNGTSLKKIVSLHLKRSDQYVVSKRAGGSENWQDKELVKRGKVNVSLTNVLSSYLILTIPKSKVATKDMGTYGCELTADRRNGLFIHQKSDQIFIEITGKDSIFLIS